MMKFVDPDLDRRIAHYDREIFRIVFGSMAKCFQ